MNDNNTPETPPIQTTPLTEEQQELFERVAEASRKIIEDMIADLSRKVAPTGLDTFHQQFAVLMGMGTANVTLMIGLLDSCGMVNDPHMLNVLIQQQSSVWNQIQDRKEAETIQ